MYPRKFVLQSLWDLAGRSSTNITSATPMTDWERLRQAARDFDATRVHDAYTTARHALGNLSIGKLCGTFGDDGDGEQNT